MKPNDYINKAIHALNTDQPNLAMLYMRRGYVEMKKLRHDPWLDARDGIRVFGEAMNSLINVFAEVAKVFEPFAQNLQKLFDQDFYELVNDES